MAWEYRVELLEEKALETPSPADQTVRLKNQLDQMHGYDGWEPVVMSPQSSGSGYVLILRRSLPG